MQQLSLVMQWFQEREGWSLFHEVWWVVCCAGGVSLWSALSERAQHHLPSASQRGVGFLVRLQVSIGQVWRNTHPTHAPPSSCMHAEWRMVVYIHGHNRHRALHAWHACAPCTCNMRAFKRQVPARRSTLKTHWGFAHPLPGRFTWCTRTCLPASVTPCAQVPSGWSAGHRIPKQDSAVLEGHRCHEPRAGAAPLWAANARGCKHAPHQGNRHDNEGV